MEWHDAKLQGIRNRKRIFGLNVEVTGAKSRKEHIRKAMKETRLRELMSGAAMERTRRLKTVSAGTDQTNISTMAEIAQSKRSWLAVVVVVRWVNIRKARQSTEAALGTVGRGSDHEQERRLVLDSTKIFLFRIKGDETLSNKLQRKRFFQEEAWIRTCWRRD